MIALRPPDTVMRLSRMGSAHQTRLSFMRVLLRGLQRGGWTVTRDQWEIDAKGVGHAVYRAEGDGQCYSLVAFAHDLPDALRSDRVIAEAWDATFALVDGAATANDVARLAAQVPLQEAGRISDRELVLSRANRSVRLWDHVVSALAEGQQPDVGQIDAVGYLMRTTAVYGSGKFGLADHEALRGRPVMDGPFRAEMLTVWLIRAFVADLVEHMARAQGGSHAVVLDPSLRARLGIGNSTGLGMAPFLVNHPGLLHAWMSARETAFARVRALKKATQDTRILFEQALSRSRRLVDSWQSEHPIQVQKLEALKHDLDLLEEHVATGCLSLDAPWDRLWLWAEKALSEEGQELTLSLILEPHGALIDELAGGMSADEVGAFGIDGSMSLGSLGAVLRQEFGWALRTDYAEPGDCARFWYVSEAKLEPRLGERHNEPGSNLEQPLDIGRAAAALACDLAEWPEGECVAPFLRAHPEHRRLVRRVQMAATAPYSEVRDNLIGAEMLPIDLLRCKLAFFGATRFDPRSDRWVRITMFQNAPYPQDLAHSAVDDWVLPALAEMQA